MKTAKKLLCNLIIYVVLMIIVASSAFAAADLTTASSSGLIINAATGQVIYANNENTRVAPGGLAKLMTLYIAAEECSNGSISRSDVVTITDRMIVESETPFLREGNEFTVEQLMYMTHFDVDPTAARALAVYMDGTEELFAENMTKTAGVLGCTDTIFRNADGREDENQYTTAHDMARIVMNALENKLFRTVFSSHMYILPKNESGVETTILTRNELQVRSSQSYSEYCTGGKASLAGDAVNSAVAVGLSQDGGFEVIAVAVNGNSMQDVFSDLKNMLKWSSDNYKLMTVLKAGESMTTVPVDMGVENQNVSAGPSGDMSFLVDKESQESDFTFEIKEFHDGGVRAPVDKGDILGEIVVSYRGQEYGRVGLTANDSVSLDKRAFAKNEIKEALLSPLSIIVFILVIAAAVLYVLYAVKYRKQLDEERQANREIMMKLAEERRVQAAKLGDVQAVPLPKASFVEFTGAVKKAVGDFNEYSAPVVYTYPADTVFLEFFTEDEPVKERLAAFVGGADSSVSKLPLQKSDGGTDDDSEKKEKCPESPVEEKSLAGVK